MRAMTEASLVDAVIQNDDGYLQAAADAVSAIICDNRSMFALPPIYPQPAVVAKALFEPPLTSVRGGSKINN
ncbi:MAG: hypothetical protein DDT33_01687 [Firmicutes bacterium]|nr:hypothetical protein [Bacillota bacterium]